MEVVAEEIIELFSNSTMSSTLLIGGWSAAAGAITRHLFRNDLVSAGLILGFLSTVLVFTRHFFISAYHRVLDYYTVSVTVNSRDAAFEWVSLYLTHFFMQSKQGARVRHLSVQSTWVEDPAGGDGTEELCLVPATGNHQLVFNSVKIRFHLDRETGQNPDQYLDTLTFSKLGRDTTVLREFVETARKHYFSDQDHKTVVFRSDSDRNCWRRVSVRNTRPLETVFLDDGIADGIVNDVRRFLNRESWYAQRGIPWRRGYLLYGPPGTGKTSFICALAGHLHMNVCILGLSERSMTDSILMDLSNSVPRRSIILLEDIDAAFVETHAAAESQGRVTFSGLLNTIDGAAAQEGSLLFMTTNYPERLAPALTRPGRVDVRVLLDKATRSQLRRAFAAFYPEASADQAEQFAQLIPERAVPMAQVQCFLLSRSDSPDAAIQDVHTLTDGSDMTEYGLPGLSSHRREVTVGAPAAAVAASRDTAPAAAADAADNAVVSADAGAGVGGITTTPAVAAATATATPTATPTAALAAVVVTESAPSGSASDVTAVSAADGVVEAEVVAAGGVATVAASS